MCASHVHVEANRKGRWIVRREDERQPLSEHENATEAQRVACELADLEGAAGVVLRDRYARVRHVRTDVRPKRNVPPRRASRSARRQDGEPPSTSQFQVAGGSLAGNDHSPMSSTVGRPGRGA